MLRKLSEWYKPSLAEKRINAGDWRGGDWGLDLPILILSLTWQPPGSFPLILDMETQVRFLSPVHTPLWIGWFVYSIVLLASSFLFQVFGVPKVNFYFQTGLHNLLQPSSRVARKWRENEKMKRKRRENEEMEKEWESGERMRKWKEIHYLHFLIFSLFPPSLSNFLYQKLSYFVAKC